MAEPNIIERNDLGEALIPIQYSNQILQQAPKASVLLKNAQTVQMTRKSRVQPVLDLLPEGFWVNGDTGNKSSSKHSWKDVKLTAEELAVIVPVPEAVVADADIDIFAEVAPRVAEAFGKAIDSAGIFGVNKPDTWTDDLVSGATAVGNTIAMGTEGDVAADITTMGQKLAEEGYNMNGFVSMPGFDWQLRGLRADNGIPIYTTQMAGDTASNTLYGRNIDACENGGWDASKAVLIGADWRQVLVGLRQDITYKVIDQGVLTDDAGKVVLNFTQQDCVGLRFTMRCGFAIANPANRVQSDASKRFPAYILTPKTVAARKN